MTQGELAERIGVKQNTVSDMEAGKLNNWPLHADKIMRALAKPRSYFEPDADDHIGAVPDLPPVDPSIAYVSVEVLPTFAGMGGRGTGDGDPEVALVSRRLVEDELRARPADLLLVNVRGPSMEPLFLHGDQLLIDTRDKSPTQPGPFALLFSDGYAIKDVAWVERRTLLRISSRNDEYPEEVLTPDEVQIIGRPVWFARRL